MDHLPQVNEAYAKFFTEDPKPVRSPNCNLDIHTLWLNPCTQARTCVAGVVLPLDAELEIEAVASLE